MDRSQSETGRRFSDRMRQSIVLSLNTRLFFRYLGVFISMDVLLCALFAGGLLFYAESVSAKYVLAAEAAGAPGGGELAFTEAAGFRLASPDADLKGYVPPEAFRFLYPEATADAARSLRMGSGDTWWDSVLGSEYVVVPSGLDPPLAVYFSLGEPLRLFGWLLLIFAIAQALALLRGLARNARTIREAIRPVNELAEAARTLNERGEMSPAELRRLAGTLNAINADHLDTRIPVSGAQEELKTLAAAINSLLDRINESYRAQARFVSDASHELRTPISVIRGYANLLDRWGKNDPETTQEAITAIKHESEAMQELVEQLLFLARSDNDTLRLTLSPVDLMEIVEEVYRETNLVHTEHRLERAPGPPVVVSGDAGLLKQALRILVDNSIKYTPPGGRILIGAKREGNEAVLLVEDEGTGVSPEALPRIFDRFYRAEESRARKTGGAGLGLSIAKRIADEHGGSFQVLSRENIGTRMMLFLPLAQAEDALKTAGPD
ncbi:sensor histidine kinase [Papillibacter cinnamivorans]|uniref:histidine kinase n=1 Tax=Papillibacter cinnamivorans DSM 12816 TaxID=1122930 RepID=A0A1W2A5X2_9FIRM|nr:HAMP domain-containing sensor histidine kinase [Papillibacter cinnamivorans]SMC56067.1 Signal transduction histidine kinase [Papillibacter cinnamivorans DSM 12816]